jgi:hypothetical protein
MDLNKYDYEVSKICIECEEHTKVCNHLNMVYQLRNHLEDSLRKVNELITKFDDDEFLENLKIYDTWIARNDIHGHKNVVVKIDSIIWEREIINWRNTTEEYPKGGDTFSHFKEVFFPWRSD